MLVNLPKGALGFFGSLFEHTISMITLTPARFLLWRLAFD
jgi:hypothetical protein